MKTFKTKIPHTLHEKIFEWYCCGMNGRAIADKLQQEHQYHTNPRTLARLLAHMKEEKQAITASVIAQKAQEQVIQDFDELTALFNDVKQVAKTAYQNDHNLYLRSVDRLTKLLQIKFAISTKEESLKNEPDHDTILEGLLEKLGSKGD